MFIILSNINIVNIVIIIKNYDDYSLYYRSAVSALDHKV